MAAFGRWSLAIAFGAALVWLAFYLDPQFQAWQHTHAWKNITILRRYVTHGTDWPVHLIAGLALVGMAWWRGDEKWKRIFLAMVVAGGLAGMEAYALKLSTGRVRPYVKVEKVWKGPSLRQNFQSFPSGHTAVSFGFFTVLLLANWRLGLLCLPIPLFVAFSRFFLGAHYFSDVVGAIVLGILTGAIVVCLMLRDRGKEEGDQVNSFS